MKSVLSALLEGEPGAYIGLGLIFLVDLPLIVLLLRYQSTARYGRHDAHNIEVKEPDWLPDRGRLPVLPPSFYPEPHEVIEDDLSRAGMFVEETTPTEIIPRVDPLPEPPAISEEIPRQRGAGGRVSAVHSGEASPTEPECTVFQNQVSAA